MPMQMTRRTFIAGGAAAVYLRAQMPSTLYLYGAESYTTFRPHDQPFVVGLLLTTDPDRHSKAIRSIKEGVGYSRVLSYRSSDRQKLGAAREVLHYFARSTRADDLRFVASLVSPTGSRDFAALEAVRVDQYRRLFGVANLPHGGILRLNRFRSSYGSMSWKPIEEHEKRAEPLLEQGLIRSSESVSRKAKDGLVELAHLLSGCLFYEANALSRSMHVKNRVKTLVAARLRQLLNVDDLTKQAGAKWQPIPHELSDWAGRSQATGDL